MAEEDRKNNPLEEFVVTAKSFQYNYYDVNRVAAQNLLRSCKFAVQFPALPPIAGGSNIPSEEMTFLCDSVEFPGQTLTTTDFRIPGKLKIRAPYMRDYSEITMSFYYSTKLDIYSIFTRWIQNISPTNTRNAYFNDATISTIKLFMFQDTEDNVFETQKRHLGVTLKKCLPISLASLPSNWSDDGFHKINVTFFYELFETSSGIKLDFGDYMKAGTVYDTPVDPNKNPAVTSIDQLINGPRTGLA
jgi:hypothetical protein